MQHAALFLALLAMLVAAGASAQPVEQDAVEDLFLQQFTAHWRAADAESLAALWHEDGDWMSLIGSRRVFKGHAQIEQVWSIGLQRRDSVEARTLTFEIDSTRTLSPSLAQVDLVMTFGHESTGIIREAMHAILRKDDGGWKILSCRVARISSMPAPPSDEATD